MKISELRGQVGEWLKGAGPESDIVLSSRVRLARNLAQFPFLTRASGEQRQQLTTLIRQAIEDSDIAPDMLFFNLYRASAMDCRFLVERHLISRELAEAKGSRAVAISRSENISLMVNEEDHLRMQVLRCGLEPIHAWNDLDEIDSKLARRLDFAFSPQLGYLTACPTNVGTGLRVSVMLHLPALVLTREIEKVFRAVSKINLAVRGLYGEGTQASGDFYQISNQVTLGKSEGEILSSIESVVPQIALYERRAREALLQDNRIRLEDRIWRAYAVLRAARAITSEETMHLLSAVRLGANLGLLEDLPIATVNQLFISTRPAHLQNLKGRKLSPEERDVARAAYIRQTLAKNG